MLAKTLFSPSSCNFGNYYCIKFGNIGYEIGIMVGQGTLFFCNKVSLENKEFIDFTDIQNDREQPKTEFINNKLEELSLLINNLAEDISLEAIEENIRNVFKEILETKQLD